MSTDARTQVGQAPPARGDETPAASAGEPANVGAGKHSVPPPAQEAERRAESLEAEIQSLRDGQDGRATALEAELSAARAEAETLRRRLDATERDRHLEREFARAGCVDPETALALARERLTGDAEPEDLSAFVRGLLDEKPHLRVTGAGSGPVAGPAAASLPPRTAAPKPAGPPVRTADRLAERARTSGSTSDLMAYMKARRAGAVTTARRQPRRGPQRGGCQNPINSSPLKGA